MANVTITQLPTATAITGQELVPIVQDGQTRQTTTAAIAAGPAQFQTFLTVNQEPTLANSRYVSATTGIGITDNGAQSSLVLTLNGASGSLEAASNGMIAKTGSTTVAARTLSTSGSGISITDGNGVAGNPTVSLTGTVGALASLATTGVLVTGGGSVNARVIAGTSGEISVANGDGSAGNPTVALASNPVVPGTGGLRLPTGTTAERTSINGYLRYNSELGIFEGYANGAWVTVMIPPGGGVISVAASGGTTGMSFSGSPITSTGTFTLTGTLGVANGGTGSTTLAANNVLLGNGTSALQAVAPGTAGNVLTSNGTTWASSALAVVSTISFGTTGLTPSTATSGAVTVAGTLAVANGGTGVTTSTGTGSTVLSTSPTFVTPILGTPTSVTLTNGTGLPIGTGVSGLGTGVATALAVNIGSAGAPVVNGGALGTPSSGTLTNATGLPLTTGVTGTLPVGNGGTGATTLTANNVLLGNGASAVQVVAPGTAGNVLTSNGTTWQSTAPTSGVSTISFGTTGLTPSTATSGAVTVAGTLAVANGGTGVTTSTGSGDNVLSTSPTLVTPILGTPTSATLTNATGLPLSTGVTGTLAIANGGTGATTAATALSNLGGVNTGKSIAMAMIFGF